MQDLPPPGRTVHLAQHHAGAVLQGQHNRRTLNAITDVPAVHLLPTRTTLAARHGAGIRDLRKLIPTKFRLSNLAVNNARGSHGNDH